MCVSACVSVPPAFLFSCVCTYVSEYVCFNKSSGGFIALIRVSALRNGTVGEETSVSLCTSARG